MDRERLLYIGNLLLKCKSIVGSETTILRSGEESYTIDFNGACVLDIFANRVRDKVDDEALDSLMNLFANGLPLLAELFVENQRQGKTIDALLDSVATIAIASSERAHSEANEDDEQKDEQKQ